MNSDERKKYIVDCFEKYKEPLKGHDIAAKLGVTRQVIVKDIAILRAKGEKIIATPKGYMLSKNADKMIRTVIAVCHKTEDIQDELGTIVKYGGEIEDVIIEHKLYGEIRGVLMIKTLFDVENFVNKLKKLDAEPLSILTCGVHLHTVVTKSEEQLENIKAELERKKYLISD